MKVIFLDIDGVLNSDAYFDSIKDRVMEGIEADIDIKTIELLNKAVKETGAKVVLDSSWRYRRKADELQEVLAKYGISIEKTPFIDNRRGEEIRQWLNEAEYVGYNVEDYILLDDDIFDDFDKEILEHLIKMDNTNSRGFGSGLQERDVSEIIKRFGRINSKHDEYER